MGIKKFIRTIRAYNKVRKYLKGSFNFRTIAGILGIGGKNVPEEEQIVVELKVYRSEDESLSASVSPEVGATKQKFVDVIVEDEESQVAEKLRECCDGFGREKPEMLGQSAASLLKLGELYRNYAKKGEGIQQKLNFIKSAALIVGAMVRYEQLKNEEGLEESKCEIRKLQDEIQKSLRKSFNVLKISHVLKGELEERRVEVLEKFNDVLRTTEESEGKVRRERLEEAYEMSAKHYLDIMRKTAEKCQDIMGKPPCKFTIVGVGSLARKETTLYSDFQHAIVLEDGITESPAFEEVMKYFRWYTTIFQIIIIGFGETSITSVNVKSLNDLYSENQSKKWFSDEYTPHGICFDSMMPNACKIPLGRQEPTKNRKHTIELIQPVSQMADLLTREEDIRNGYHLSEILSKTIFVFGNQEVYDCYLKALHHSRSQQTAKTFLVQQLQRLVFPNITTSHPWFLYAVQERLTSVLSCLANLFELRSQSGFQIVHDLLDNGAIDHYMYYELMDAFSVGMEIKIKIHHLILIHKARNFSHVQVTNLVKEERVVSCYKTVMQYTILLQHQLLVLLREYGILEMQLFPDETYWENNKIITRRLGMQVLWREVDVGLDRTYEAIDKYEKHAEISSAEAKFVIRVASDALSTVFQHTVFLQRSIDWIKNSDLSLSGKLESHCTPFLKFLKDDNQALIYFYSMLFLIHYEQKNFQQAYEDYEKWQQLRHSQQNHRTYRRNHWMDFLQVEVLNQVTVTHDTLERIKQQIAAEADIPKRWVLIVQYCTVLLKMNQEGKAKKRLLMMAKRKRAKPEYLKVLMEFLLVFLSSGIRITSVKIFKMLQNANSSKRSKFLSICKISGMEQEILKQRSEHCKKLARDIRLESTEIRILQHNYTTSLFEALSLAVDCFSSDRTKSASLLWRILHERSVTKPVMLESVLLLFRHFWCDQSLQAVDGKIMDVDKSSDTIPREHEHETVTVPLSDSISTQARPPGVDNVSSTSLHQEERPEGTSDNEEIPNIQEDPDVDSSTEEINGDVSSTTGQLEIEADPESTKISAVGDDEQVAVETEHPDVDSRTEEIIADVSSTTGQLEVEADPESTKISAVGDDEQVAVETGHPDIDSSTEEIIADVSSTTGQLEADPESTKISAVGDDEQLAVETEHPDVDSSTEEIIADVSSTTGLLEADPESTKISAVGDDEQVAVETGAIAGGFPSNEPLQLDFQYSELDADGEIGPEGGDLAVDECSLTVPPKSLADTRNLGISMSMKFKNLGLPADKVPISPYLDIKFRGELRIPAIARVPTWFMPAEDSEHGIKIYKRYRDEENKFTWRELPNEVKVRDGIIEFEVDHFCGFIAMIKDWFYWIRGKIRLKHGLFQLNRNFLSVICYRSPESLFRQNVAALNADGYKGKNENLFVMNTNQGLAVRMECIDAHLHEFQPQEHLLPATHLINNPTTRLTFLLRHLIEPKVAADIRYLVNNFPAVFEVELPPLKDLRREGQRAPDPKGTGSSAQTTIPAVNAPINLNCCTVNPPENPDVDSSTEEIIADLSSTTGQISAVGDDEQVAVETATSTVGIHIHLAGDGAILNIGDVRVHAGDKGGDSTVINAPVGQLTTGNANTTNQGAGNNFVAGSQENTDRSVTAGKAIYDQSTSSSVGENIMVHRTGE